MSKTGKAILSSTDLAAAVQCLVELATEYEMLLAQDSIDTEIFELLLDKEGTQSVLEKVVDLMQTHRERRLKTVRKLRVVHFIDMLLRDLRATTSLPSDAKAKIESASQLSGLDLSPPQIAAVLDALRRQGDSVEGRAFRVFKALDPERAPGERTLEQLLSHFRQEAHSGEDARAPSAALHASVDRPAQLLMSMYEGAGATEHVRYVLGVLGHMVPVAKEAALLGWEHALRAQVWAAMRSASSRPCTELTMARACSASVET